MCVEFKVVRSKIQLDRAIDQVITDMSKYGSKGYTRFVALYCTFACQITLDFVAAEQNRRLAPLGANPKYNWTTVVAQGPLANKT